MKCHNFRLQPTRNCKFLMPTRIYGTSPKPTTVCIHPIHHSGSAPWEISVVSGFLRTILRNSLEKKLDSSPNASRGRLVWPSVKYVDEYKENVVMTPDGISGSAYVSKVSARHLAHWIDSRNTQYAKIYPVKCIQTKKTFHLSYSQRYSKLFLWSNPATYDRVN